MIAFEPQYCEGSLWSNLRAGNLLLKKKKWCLKVPFVFQSPVVA